MAKSRKTAPQSKLPVEAIAALATDNPMTFAEMVKARGEICAMQVLEVMEEAWRAHAVDSMFTKTVEQRWATALDVLSNNPNAPLIA